MMVQFSKASSWTFPSARNNNTNSNDTKPSSKLAVTRYAFQSGMQYRCEPATHRTRLLERDGLRHNGLRREPAEQNFGAKSRACISGGGNNQSFAFDDRDKPRMEVYVENEPLEVARRMV